MIDLIAYQLLHCCYTLCDPMTKCELKVKQFIKVVDTPPGIIPVQYMCCNGFIFVLVNNHHLKDLNHHLNTVSQSSLIPSSYRTHQYSSDLKA